LYDKPLSEKEPVQPLRREVRAWNRKANRNRIKIDWKFTRTKARRKLRYKRTTFMRSENQKQ
jgi:hypothetical protein